MRLGNLMTAQHSMTEIDASNNAVVLALSEQTPSSELQTLTQAASADNVNVEVRKVPESQLPIQPMIAEWECKFVAEKTDYCSKPLIEGTEIYSQAYQNRLHLCTAGFQAQSILPQQYPDHYLLTAGHCFRSSNTYMNGEWSSATAKEEPHGIGYRNYSYINEQGDAAFINLDVENAFWFDGPEWPWYPTVYTPGKPWGPGGSEQYDINIVGTNEPPNVQYEAPCHVGMSSGVRCGVTEYTNVSSYISYHEPTEQVLVGNLVQNSACSIPGDSGGPWIFNNYAMGLEVAGQGSEKNCYGISLFDDLHAADHVMGMKVVGLEGTVE